MENQYFDRCASIAQLIDEGKQSEARESLIRLLDAKTKAHKEGDPLINHLCREVGLYPYMDDTTSYWQDALAHHAFDTDVGEKDERSLHIEQSKILKRLLNGESIALSAPTSFGKSFIIDAYISQKRPDNVVIIVPTIALMDETRRRLNKKFSAIYNIITLPNEELKDKNIFIFPEERVFQYSNLISEIDILIVDEFYKASDAMGDSRAPVLQNAILKLVKKSKQRYYLMPNISSVDNISPLMDGMSFIYLNFNTVNLEYINCYEDIPNEEKGIEQRKDKLIEIIGKNQSKTLIYAGIPSEVGQVEECVMKNLPEVASPILSQFAEWLEANYGSKFYLANLIRRRCGIHNGKLHRSLCHLQVKLFNEDDGINNLISTSSIIEGVNTAAENVVLWAAKRGLRQNIDRFMYNNIAGRGGRMFKYFIGKIYNLVPPPPAETTTLNLQLNEDFLVQYNGGDGNEPLTKEQLAKIIAFNDAIDTLVGEKDSYRKVVANEPIMSMNPDEFRKNLEHLKTSKHWKKLRILNDENSEKWKNVLYYLLLKTSPKNQGVNREELQLYLQIAPKAWKSELKDILQEFSDKGVSADKYFAIEKCATFSLASRIHDMSRAYNLVHSEKVDLSPFITRLSSAFLPKLVYSLEEFGMPRTVSRKIQNSGVIDLERTDVPMNQLLREMQTIGAEELKQAIKCKDGFDAYIIDNFFDGIMPNTRQCLS